VPARANGQPAFGAYLRSPAGTRHGTGLYVLTLAGDRICTMTRFETGVLPWFGLPRRFPAADREPPHGWRPARSARRTRITAIAITRRRTAIPEPARKARSKPAASACW